MRVRTEARRQAIIEAAARLFEEVGYEAASMNELAKRLGGSKATLYGYFASKEELFAAVVQTDATAYLADATARLLDALAGPFEVEALLMDFGDRALQVLANDRRAIAVYRMIVAEASRSDIGQLFQEAGPRQAVEALARVMAVGVAQGRLRDIEPLVAANQFLALLTAEVSSRLFERESAPIAPAEVRRKVARAVETFLRGTVRQPAAAVVG
ncbi:MAG: TetR/AcrR family transcriptional regulator [Comamonas sp.]